MKGTRILRYVGNREKPESELYSTEERRELLPAPTLTEPTELNFGSSLLHALYPEFEKDGDLWVRPMSMPYIPSFLYGFSAPKPKPPSVFDVNVMEALVGWKSWCLEDDGVLGSSMWPEIKWPVDEPLVAKCTSGCLDVPDEYHTCGIYAASTREQVLGYSDMNGEDFIGLVYGWGRYIRGVEGWRAQFAYPKCFYLNSGQIALIEKLKAYHVPIYVEQPQLIYNPEEDGYEYRGEEADGDSRTYTESFTAEEGDFEADED